MTSRSSHIELAHSGEWVPKAEAIQEAMTVYTEFAYNLGCMEDLVHLSAAYRTGNVDSYLKLQRDDLTQRLISRMYLSDSLGILSARLTIKARVAYNMVVPDIDEAAIAGHLVEPFKDRDIFEELYQAYQKNRDLRRQSETSNFPT